MVVDVASHVPYDCVYVPRVSVPLVLVRSHRLFAVFQNQLVGQLYVVPVWPVLQQ